MLLSIDDHYMEDALQLLRVPQILVRQLCVWFHSSSASSSTSSTEHIYDAKSVVCKSNADKSVDNDSENSTKTSVNGVCKDADETSMNSVCNDKTEASSSGVCNNGAGTLMNGVCKHDTETSVNGVCVEGTEKSSTGVHKEDGEKSFDIVCKSTNEKSVDDICKDIYRYVEDYYKTRLAADDIDFSLDENASDIDDGGAGVEELEEEVDDKKSSPIHVVLTKKVSS